MNRSTAVVILLFSLVAEFAFGWGQTGHRVIGAIAENHLSRKAQKEIAKILGDESLAMGSTWMDEIRSDDHYDHTHDWHWVSIPNDKNYEETEKNPDGDLVEATERMIDILKREEATQDEKRRALLMLVHLVGDLHQPLHVGTGDDRGGNAVKVEFFWEPSNLHRVWDSGMIDKKQLSYSELVCAIDHPEDEQVDQWLQGDIRSWANEAKAYRDQVYDIGEEKKISYEYMYQNWSLVEQQLLKGGVRLAGILNAIYG